MNPTGEAVDPIKLWEHIHGATAHFPIALMIVSFLFDVGGVVLKRPGWRHVGFWTLLIAALGTIPLILSGLTGQLGWFHEEPWSADHILLHRNIALISGGVIWALTIWRGARERHHFTGRSHLEAAAGMRAGELVLYLLLLTTATIAVGATGYLGAYVAKGY